MKLFRVRYKLNSVDAAWDTHCSSPITALNQFHKHVQVELARKPEEYELASLNEVYNSDPTGAGRGIMIESPYDLPHSANPVVQKEVIAAQQDNSSFGFLKKAIGGRLAE